MLTLVFPQDVSGVRVFAGLGFWARIVCVGTASCAFGNLRTLQQGNLVPDPPGPPHSRASPEFMCMSGFLHSTKFGSFKNCEMLYKGLLLIGLTLLALSLCCRGLSIRLRGPRVLKLPWPWFAASLPGLSWAVSQDPGLWPGAPRTAAVQWSIHLQRGGWSTVPFGPYWRARPALCVQF